MYEVQSVAESFDYFTYSFALVVALMVLMCVGFTTLAYVAIKQILAIRGAPCAFFVEDLQPGQILLVESRQKGRNVKIRAVQIDDDNFGGGYVETSEDEVIRIPSGTLVLAV